MKRASKKKMDWWGKENRNDEIEGKIVGTYDPWSYRYCHVDVYTQNAE